MMSVLLIIFAGLCLFIADTLAFGQVREDWIAKQHRIASQNFQPVSDWLWSKQRDIARIPFGALWCYYFRVGATT